MPDHDMHQTGAAGARVKDERRSFLDGSAAKNGLRTKQHTCGFQDHVVDPAASLHHTTHCCPAPTVFLKVLGLELRQLALVHAVDVVILRLHLLQGHHAPARVQDVMQVGCYVWHMGEPGAGWH